MRKLRLRTVCHPRSHRFKTSGKCFTQASALLPCKPSSVSYHKYPQSMIMFLHAVIDVTQLISSAVTKKPSDTSGESKEDQVAE